MTDNTTNRREESGLLEGSRDVRLTVVNLDNQDDEYTLDFSLIGGHLKRLLALWLCLAVGLGALAGGGALLAQRAFLTEDVMALIEFSGSASYDIKKMKSPAVVEAAMTELNLDLKNLEDIRNAISLKGVIPDSAIDQMSMYYNIISQGGVNAVQSLLSTEYRVSRYIISFDCSGTGLSREDGLAFMNALLRAYEDYFSVTYDDNVAMGSSLTAVDYRDYDYAEAANIFSAALDSLTSYLNSVESSGNTASFRSTETGFSFQDLRRAAATLRDIDLDRISSYITIHSVSSNDAATEIAYYQWRIENLTRQRAVQRTKLASLTQSIADYEKDPVLIAVQDGNSVVADMEDLNANYDAMITEKLETQATIASYTRSIGYFESVIEGFQSAEASSPEDIAQVEGYLSSLNEKVNSLMDTASRTVNEYYERMAFANRVRILIPATAKNPPLVSKMAVLFVAAVEFVVFGAFFAIAFFKGLRRVEKHTGRKSEAAAE